MAPARFAGIERSPLRRSGLIIGIGANTAMFSIAYGMLLRPLPYADSDHVAVVYMNYLPREFVFGTMCVRDYRVWSDNNHAFEEPSLFRRSHGYRRSGGRCRAGAGRVSRGFLSPRLGCVRCSAVLSRSARISRRLLHSPYSANRSGAGVSVRVLRCWAERSSLTVRRRPWSEWRPALSGSPA